MLGFFNFRQIQQIQYSPVNEPNHRHAVAQNHAV